MSKKHVVVVGAGHAGGTFVALLRREGFDGPITLIGAEEHLPYKRPPLSKSFYIGAPRDWLYDSEFYGRNNIAVRLNETVTAIDRSSQEVSLSSGERLVYGTLVLATGSRPRQLPIGEGLKGIQSLRTLSDADALTAAVHSRRPLAIIGGGYVGLEVAAAARAHGTEVTVIEREDRVLARVGSPTLSALLTRHHRAQGTRIITGVGTAGYASQNGKVTGVHLSDGSNISCAAVLVGVGATPNDELARAAGIHCENGITVDDQARTSDPAILALGDATNRPTTGAVGSRMRLESIPSAVEQAKRAVALLMGKKPDSPEIPWFWSDQFDLKVKIAGLVQGDYQTIQRGEQPTKGCALYHHNGEHLVAAETINAPKDFMVAKKLIASQARIDIEALRNPATDLRSLAAA